MKKMGGLVRSYPSTIIWAMEPSPKTASIIIPTFCEAPNLRTLIERTTAAARLANVQIEIIIVDDNSQDGTEEIVAELAGQYPVELLLRRDARGLSSAVAAGLKHARCDRFVVMDGDLQHPPQAIGELLAKLDDTPCDFVVATRYASGAKIAENWPIYRRFASRVARVMAKPLMPVSDPLSGFFAIPRAVWERSNRINPIGYKIALEIYVKAGCRYPAEVPITFAARRAGKSKLNLTQQLQYVWHLLHLYPFRFPVTSVAIIVAIILGCFFVLWRFMVG